MQKKLHFTLFLFFILCGYAAHAQTTIISPTGDGGFETGTSLAANNWTVVQNGGGAASKWQVGNATTNAGARAAYISTDNGTTNDYAIGTARVQHFYRDVTFPVGEPYITLSFNWKGVMESCCDYMQVFLVSTATTPVAGTQVGVGQIGSNMNNQATWQSATFQLPCSLPGTTQRLVFSFRCDGSLGTQPPAAVDNISLVSNNVGPTCVSTLGIGVTNIAALPYSATGQTTCGMVNNQTSSNTTVCGSSNYYTGEDVVYVFTPTTTGNITITLTSSGSYTGLMLYDGCPSSAVCSGGGACVANAQSSTGNKTLCANVNAGTTYYLIIDSYAAPSCNPFDISISAPTPSPAGSICSTAPVISLPYSATGQTTTCFGNDYTNASIGSCGSFYESGEDRVYALTVAGSTCIGVTLSNASTTSIGFQVYNGCPGNVGTTCVGNFGGANPLSGTVVLPAAGTYYIVVDTWASPTSANYDIAVASLGAGPINDLPCSATVLPLNVNLSGDNNCSSNASEPAAPVCWTNGTINTVWYSVVCPASGQLRIRTTLGTLSNTQIALYSGTCGSLTYVACNDNAPSCGTSSYNNSEILATGLTAGSTYFIVVDGVGNLSGTFDIMAVDGSIGFAAAAGQDCSSPNPVCASTITVGNPGYQAYGNICDFTGAGTCLTSGERGSAWYNIPISANGNLAFDIVPNDWPGAPSTAGTDYDFAIWKIVGAGSTTCAAIASVGGSTPVRCNYSGLGVTGCFSNVVNTAPGAYPGFNFAYETQIPVLAGEVYLLVVSNFSNSTSGFTMNFGASPINYASVGSTVTWTGGNNTSWLLAANWGGCLPPACGISAVVLPASANQPVLNAGNFYVNNLTINPGGVLTLNAGAILHICGDFVNNGSLVCSPTSTIVFDNAAVVQNMSGAFVGADKVGHLTVTKTGGSVILNNNVDVGGNLTTSNGTSVLNVSGRYIRVAGNFANNNGAATMTNVAGSTFEFNGTGAQTYNQGASTLNLNHVLMNKTAGTNLTTNTNMVIATGTLTLTSGRILTGANEVQTTNTSPASCTAGNNNSYIIGNLRRSLNGAAAAYEFPMGHTTMGYERATITFTTPTTIPNLLGTFTSWGVVPFGPAASECTTNTYNVLNVENHGCWIITASANPTSGNYDMTCYNQGYTNAAGAAGWTITKAPSALGPWGLSGTCVGTSTAAVTSRTGMNGFSAFAIGQSVLPLPIELLYFRGEATADYNHLYWSTASEINNDHFEVQRSSNGGDWNTIAEIQGNGTSSETHNYVFDDYFAEQGSNYYRLKQVDYNGQFTYSSVIHLEYHTGNMVVDNLHPNPTTGDVNFDFQTPDATDVQIVITDMTGRVVVDEKRSVQAGRTSIAAKIAETEGAGIYSLKVIEANRGVISVMRLVKY
jgi:hypothetical protein